MSPPPIERWTDEVAGSRTRAESLSVLGRRSPNLKLEVEDDVLLRPKVMDTCGQSEEIPLADCSCVFYLQVKRKLEAKARRKRRKEAMKERDGNSLKERCDSQPSDSYATTNSANKMSRILHGRVTQLQVRFLFMACSCHLCMLIRLLYVFCAA